MYENGFYFCHDGIGAFLENDVIAELDAYLDDEAFEDIVINCIGANDEPRKQNTANWLREQIALNY